MIYEIKNLTYSYKESEKVFDSINLGIEKGELLTVLGRNGAGKSTLFSCMMGLFKDYQGSILLDGKEIKELKEKDIAARVGFVPQNHNPVFGFRVIDFVTLGLASSMGLFARPGKEEEEKSMEALCLLGIEEYRDKDYSKLSGGERQQVTIARALAAKPDVILFDEPTAHLDYSNQIKVLRVIKKLSLEGYTIAVTTHDPNHALLLGGSTALFDGKGHVEKGISEKLVTEEKLKSIYGTDIRIRHLDEFNRKVCIYPEL